MAGSTTEDIRNRVLHWETVIRDDSPMYSEIALAVVDSAEMLELLEAVRPGQLEMNMLLGATQYMLFDRPDDPLAEWYPSLGGERTGGELAATFTAFVLGHREAVKELINTRRVQTNEVARCTFLLPAYNHVIDSTSQPIALIEVGTSAGLTQNLDRYGYLYQSRESDVSIGQESPVHLTCSTGDRLPSTTTTVPEIVSRTGLDIHPVDATDADQARWLRALVWPDRIDRHERLVAALAVAQSYPPAIVRGDAFDAVPGLVEAAPDDAAIVIQHSWVLNQFAEPDRERFFALLDELSADRPIHRVGAEMLQKDRGTLLEVTVHGPDRRTTELAEVHHHGTWIRWHEA